MTIFTKDFQIPENVKVISFDIFDTLLLRPFEKPTDVFSFLNQYVTKMIGKDVNFKALRKAAEKEARQKLFPKEEITIDEIYEFFTEIPVKFRGAIKFLEIETELKLCFKRKSAEIIYEKAKSMGFTIIAISDIYFEEPILRRLLQKNGIECDYVFSSASLKKTKKNGSIFPVILNQLGIEGFEMLHIGDNIISDIEKAKIYGIQTFHLPLLRKEFYKNSEYNRLFKNQNNCLMASTLLASLFAKLDEQKSLPQKNLFNDNLYNLGFNAFGMIMLPFVNWVFEKAVSQKIDTLFFVARDGFLMQKMMQILHNNAPFRCEYLEVSRKSIQSLQINSKEDVIEIFSQGFRNTSIKNFISEKLECDPSKIAEDILFFGFKNMKTRVKHFIFLPSDKKRLKKVIEFYSDEILKKMQAEKVNALKYLNKSGVLSNQKVALCDVGYSGTTQKIIANLRGSEEIYGYYLLTNWKAKKVKNTFGFLRNFMFSIKFKRFRDAIRIMETVIFSAPSGTVKEYDRSGNPVHSKLEKYEQKRLDANASTWKGIIDFALLIQKRFGVESKYITYNVKSISRIFIDFALTPEKKDAHLLKGVFFENKSNAGGYRNLISKGGWKIGYFAIKYSFLTKPFKVLFRKFINPFL